MKERHTDCFTVLNPGQTRAASAAFDVASASLRINSSSQLAEYLAKIILGLIAREPMADCGDLARRALVIFRFRRTISRNAVPEDDVMGVRFTL